MKADAVDALLDRDAELAALDQALDLADRRRGSLVVIEGAAGIGRSRLIAAASERGAARGLTVLRARGAELEQDSAFGVALQLVGPLAARGDRADLFAGLAGLAAPLFDPATPAAPDPGALVEGLYWTIANLIAADGAGLLLAVDDAHWSDGPSLRLLAHLAARIDDLPLVLTVAVRTGDPNPRGAGLDALRAASGAHLLEPAPLTEAAIGQLVADALPHPDPAFSHACARASGGNPFMLRELLQALRSDGVEPTASQAHAVRERVPETVRRSVAGRVERLGDDARRLAFAVAVLGDGAPLRRAAALADLGPSSAEASADLLAAAGILRHGEPLAFAYSLLAAAVRGAAGAYELSAAHRRAAAMLLADGLPPDAAGAHLLATRPDADREVVATLRRAAARAVQRADHAAAARFLGRALDEPPPAGERADLLVALGRAELLAGDPAAARHLADALETLDDPEGRAEALATLAAARHSSDDREGAAQTIEQALDELPPADPRAESMLAQYLTVAMMHAPLRHRAESRAAPLLHAVRAGSPPADPGLLAHAALRLALGGDPPARVRAVAERALTGGPLIDPETHGALTGLVLHALVAVDELDLAERAATDALAVAERRGAVVAAGTASHHRALARLHLGALAGALADMDAALLPRDAGWSVGDPWIADVLARVRLARGDLAGARDALALADGASPSMADALVMHTRAEVALGGGDAPAAFTAAIESGRLLSTGYGFDHPGLLDWRSTAALAAQRAGDAAAAASLADDAVQTARRAAVPRALGHALRVAGLVAASRPAGLQLLQEAVSTLERSPAALERAHALTDLGSALRRAGQRTAARETLARAVDLVDPMEAAPIGERARSELRATGARPRPTGKTGAGALTPSERRVAALAAGGDTNAEIAQALFVTSRTVETHLARAYAKLGINSRRQLGAALADPGAA